VPGVLALGLAIVYRNHPKRRIVSLYLPVPCLRPPLWGGNGVTMNVLFGGMLSQAMLLGLFLDDLQSAVKCPPWLSTAAPMFLFVWLAIPLAFSGNWRPFHALAEARAAQQRFVQETEFLAAQPGPALCESLLRCYYAQKPYVYDPFNATRLIHLGKLDPQVIAAEIERQEFGAVQLDKPIANEYLFLPGRSDLSLQSFAPSSKTMLPVLENEDGVIYTPNRDYRQALEPKPFQP